jgi:hypothetical protein
VADADVREPLARGQHVVDVDERLAHPHEHGVVDLGLAAEVERLVEDLGLRQVASELHAAGRAERAGERAARLRAQAQAAPAVAIAHEDGLDGPPIVGAEEGLLGAVAGLGVELEVERAEWNLAGQGLPKRGGQVGHLVVGASATSNPLPDLPGAERRLVVLGERLLEKSEIHALILAAGAKGAAVRT